MEFSFNNYQLVVTKNSYLNGRTYLGLETSEGEMYADISVNIPNVPCSDNKIFVDTNNIEPELYQTLISNNIISTEIFGYGCSGFYEYPLHKIILK